MTALFASAYSPILPNPKHLQEVWGSAGWVFTIWAGAIGLLLLPYCMRKYARDRDPIPGLMWMGGLFASLLEPMLDHLSHIWWATDLPGPVFKGYGLSIPWLIPPCYTWVVGMTSYALYRILDRGIATRQLYRYWLGLFAIGLALEWPGVLLKAYVYYGNQPWKFAKLSLWTSWTNGTGYLISGFLLWIVAPRLRGRSTAVILLLPVSGLAASWGVTGWLNSMALNWKLPDVIAWGLSACSFGLCLLVVKGIAVAATTDSDWTLQHRRSEQVHAGAEAA
jgi:hypothetical protein